MLGCVSYRSNFLFFIYIYFYFFKDAACVRLKMKNPNRFAVHITCTSMHPHAPPRSCNSKHRRRLPNLRLRAHIWGDKRCIDKRRACRRGVRKIEAKGGDFHLTNGRAAKRAAKMGAA